MKLEATVSRFVKKYNGDIGKAMSALNAAGVKPPKGENAPRLHGVR